MFYWLRYPFKLCSSKPNEFKVMRSKLSSEGNRGLANLVPSEYGVLVTRDALAFLVAVSPILDSAFPSLRSLSGRGHGYCKEENPTTICPVSSPLFFLLVRLRSDHVIRALFQK
jgi:hypothetical protein